MTSESDNVAIVRRFYDRWNAEDLDGVVNCADPSSTGRPRAHPGAASTHGHEGLMKVWEEQLDAWDSFNVEIAEATDLDDERVMTVTVVRGRGRGSGASVQEAQD